ncbi:Pr6Pr family membrane protein [Microbacterium sp. C7(2022)]|uniref:Pr6Pr family membrane protein n=1 Tax=Microbacterium sp. C7(2022) TaxID=2992759 RepID=UPI00237C2A40|nr:Pr6Pr family membrane protein [Microbacterium sp. C7(2022)]MDE0546359.1 Pr6Pr family membrane protein [Microbacterium sp. C7(2022)]
MARANSRNPGVFSAAFVVRAAIVIVIVAGLLLGERRFPFFTSQSNLIALGYFVTTLVLMVQRRAPAAPAPRLRAAVTFWLLTTALISHFLNNHGESPIPGLLDPNPIVAIDNTGLFLLHYVSPALVLLDWLVFGPHGIVRWRDTLLWLLFPIGYGVVMITRGMLLPDVNDRWPYPFLDPTTAGVAGMIPALGRVVLILAAIALAVVALDRLAWALTRRRVSAAAAG